MHFFSHAKLLLTGEYLVLLGAKALAMPLKFGQSMYIEASEDKNFLHWYAMENGTIWFEVHMNVPDLEIQKTNDDAVASFLLQVLKAAKVLNPYFLKSERSVQVKTDLNFKRNWGLGTSSTLISNVAYWANVDPFHLHWKVSHGSGYDIACAREKSPLIYSVSNQTPVIRKVSIDLPFKDKIYFVYLGKKQNSALSIQNFEKNPAKYQSECKLISQITDDFLNSKTLKDAEKLLEEHEKIIGSIINKAPIKELYFKNFKGGIKSLGAWGGDFAMILSSEPFSYILDYFRSHDLQTIYSFNDIIPEKLNKRTIPETSWFLPMVRYIHPMLVCLAINHSKLL